jgi:hypothetical protein
VKTSSILIFTFSYQFSSSFGLTGFKNTTLRVPQFDLNSLESSIFLEPKMTMGWTKRFSFSAKTLAPL